VNSRFFNPRANGVGATRTAGVIFLGGGEFFIELVGEGGLPARLGFFRLGFFSEFSKLGKFGFFDEFRGGRFDGGLGRELGGVVGRGGGAGIQGNLVNFDGGEEGGARGGLWTARLGGGFSARRSRISKLRSSFGDARGGRMGDEGGLLRGAESGLGRELGDGGLGGGFGGGRFRRGGFRYGGRATRSGRGGGQGNLGGDGDFGRIVGDDGGATTRLQLGGMGATGDITLENGGFGRINRGRCCIFYNIMSARKRLLFEGSLGTAGGRRIGPVRTEEIDWFGLGHSSFARSIIPVNSEFIKLAPPISRPLTPSSPR